MKLAYFVSYTYKQYGQERASFHHTVIAGVHPFQWLKVFEREATVTIINFREISLCEWENFPSEKWNGSEKISKEAS